MILVGLLVLIPGNTRCKVIVVTHLPSRSLVHDGKDKHQFLMAGSLTPHETPIDIAFDNRDVRHRRHRHFRYRRCATGELCPGMVKPATESTARVW